MIEKKKFTLFVYQKGQNNKNTGYVFHFHMQNRLIRCNSKITPPNIHSCILYNRKCNNPIMYLERNFRESRPQQRKIHILNLDCQINKLKITLSYPIN